MTDSVSLSEAVRQYLTTLEAEERVRQQADLVKFSQWAGVRSAVAALTPFQVETYQAQLENNGAATTIRLGAIKEFLGWVDKHELGATRLAKYIKLKRAPTSRRGGAAPTRETREVVKLTAEGFKRLKDEFEHLTTTERKNIAQALLDARADRDIRENAPYDAAKNHQAQVEARIRELQAILARAEVIDERSVVADKISIGSVVVVRDLIYGDDMRYTLVSSNEANPRLGRISTSSPVGKALLDRQVGDEIEVAAPGGMHRYEIVTIENR